ncbi:MAG: twin-arginine translocase subunit TatC [Deltaproteobacteria bacterium]|nr:twin-arginine translocase subunit TatC [Deltaproteobacteria bacterium]
MDENGKMPFISHLEELRTRLIVCSVAVGIGFSVSYAFKETVFGLLMRPLAKVMGPEQKMIYTALPEAFFSYLKVALLAGVILSAPVILHQMWLFVAPGLYRHERRLALPMVFISTIFFAGGVCFAYFIVFPFAFKYLLGFETELVRALPSMREYLGLAATLLIAFGFIFQLPLIITILARIGVLTPRFLRKNRKYAILLFFVAAAIVTPTPDVVNQLLMAGPLMVLYEISIIGAKIFGQKKEEKAPK